MKSAQTLPRTKKIRKEVKRARLVRKKAHAAKGTIGKIEGKARHKIAKKLGI